MIHKTILYDIFCENYLECGKFEDAKELPTGTYPSGYFKTLGYKPIDGKWYCAKCAEKLLNNKLKEDEDKI